MEVRVKAAEPATMADDIFACGDGEIGGREGDDLIMVCG